MRNKRARNGESDTIVEYTARYVLQKNGEDTTDLAYRKDLVSKKITNLDPSTYVYVQNKSLFELTEKEISFIYNNLDWEKYLELLRNAYEKSWRNILPDSISAAGYERSEDTEVSDETAETM